jgi:hypothetical protein
MPDAARRPLPVVLHGRLPQPPAPHQVLKRDACQEPTVSGVDPRQRIAELLPELGTAIEELHGRVAQLEAALNGLIGLVQLLSHNRHIDPDIRADIVEHHRFVEALRCFPDTDWSEYGLAQPASDDSSNKDISDGAKP